jgi:endonuclease/exonuclease/phosphatase family metal-dependent hydrolase
MPGLRILSWNIRTLGSHPKTGDDIYRIANIILDSKADIVCIQELMIGNGVVGAVGADISQGSFDIIKSILEDLAAMDDEALWWGTVSGVNSGVSDHMRDAYAFLWKQVPGASKDRHANPVDSILALGEPVILRQVPADHFPGRRPGMLSVNIVVGNTTTPLNIISYHAPTPCNKFSKGSGSGYGINALATLPEIGGGMQQSTGHTWSYVDSVTPLPQIDTIVLGDFNYSMDDKHAPFTYKNLFDNYQACVSTPEKPTFTTYSPNPQQALRLVSAYDNIFVLKKHSTFQPSCIFNGRFECIDFIKDEAEQLGEEMQIDDVGAREVWSFVHTDDYGKQHAVHGLSDHLPVWAEFTIGGGSTASTSQRILSTSGAGNNCLLHAIYGVLTNGQYFDGTAQTRRNNLFSSLMQYLKQKAFPSVTIRNAVLSGMINVFSGDAGVITLLRAFLLNAAVDPFTSVLLRRFGELLGEYALGIKGNRMLYVHEAEVLAEIDNITVVLWLVDRGQYRSQTINAGPGRAGTVTIFHQGYHFSRFTG